MTENWPTLARAIKVRRAELRLGQEDVAARGGPSSATQRKLESGTRPVHRPNASTFHRLDRALRWSEGRSLAILAGDAPQGSQMVDEEITPRKLIWALADVLLIFNQRGVTEWATNFAVQKVDEDYYVLIGGDDGATHRWKLDYQGID